MGRARKQLAATVIVLAAALALLFVTASRADGGAPFGSPPPSWYLAKSVHLNLRGSPSTASFTVKIVRPHKIILYPEATSVSTSTVCLKGTAVSHLSRTFHTYGTRNLLWHLPGRFDACYVTVGAAQGKGAGYVSVQAMVRSA